MTTDSKLDALVLGSGLGGLSTAVLLARLGFRVAVIEKNPLPGGLLRSYRRGGLDCPVGVHYFGAFGEGEPLRRMCDFIGVTEGIAAERMGQGGPIDRYLFDDFTFDLPEGLDAFTGALHRAFPRDAQRLDAIAGNLRVMADLQNSFAFLSATPPLMNLDLFRSLDAYLSGMGCSLPLKSVLNVAASWVGMSGAECPVLYHHLALTSYLQSSWRLKGRGSDLADAFVSRLDTLGGRLILGDPAEAILASGGGVSGVRLASGRVLSADRVVAALHPKTVLGMLPEGALKPLRVRRIRRLAETEGLFVVSAAVDARAHPALPHNLFRLRADREGGLAEGVFYQLLSGTEEWNLLMIITKSLFAEWRRWENTTTGRRGADYEAEKAGRADRFLRQAEEVFGPLHGARVLDAHTPLTLRDWTGSPEGAPYGILRSTRQLPAAATLHRPTLAGLYLAGQNALSPGILGTMLGSFQVARQMIGQERFSREVLGPLRSAPA